MDKGRIQINGRKDKEIDDDAEGLTYLRWHRQKESRKGRGWELASIKENRRIIKGLEDIIKRVKKDKS